MDKFPASSIKQQWVACFFGVLMLLMASVLQAQDAAGTAISVRGFVTATNDNGDVRRLKRGDAVYSGDTLQTAKRSRLRLSFSDGSTTVMKSNTTFEISDYNFSGTEDGSERASFKLVQGAIEALSGLIGKKNKSAFRLDTPLATIGLRGTEYVVAVYPPRTPGGRPTIRVSVVGGAIVYSSPGAPPIAVNQGNSVTQTAGTQPRAQNTIVEPLITISVEGDDVEDALDTLFEPEVTTEEEAREAEGRNEEIIEEEPVLFLEETREEPVEEPVEEPTIEDLATDLRETGEETPQSVVEPELIEPVFEDLRDQGLTDEQINQAGEELRRIIEDAGGCPEGQEVSLAAPSGCAAPR